MKEAGLAGGLTARARNSWEKRAKYVFKATKQHATNLARFAAIYKTCLLLQKTLAGGKQRAADTFFAGLIGGWFVFSERNAVNEQVSAVVVAISLHRPVGPPGYFGEELTSHLARLRSFSTSFLE